MSTEIEPRTEELIRCVNFAINHLHKQGSGLVLRQDSDATEFHTEHFTEWFMRSVEAFGMKYDRELVEWQRASKVNRKRMEKDPAFAAKLEKARNGGAS